MTLDELIHLRDSCLRTMAGYVSDLRSGQHVSPEHVAELVAYVNARNGEIVEQSAIERKAA